MYPETLSRNTEQERNQDATFQVHEIDVNCKRDFKKELIHKHKEPQEDLLE